LSIISFKLCGICFEFSLTVPNTFFCASSIVLVITTSCMHTNYALLISTELLVPLLLLHELEALCHQPLPMYYLNFWQYPKSCHFG
jgi:hypothetical protein